jgi:hypothetical protein
MLALFSSTYELAQRWPRPVLPASQNLPGEKAPRSVAVSPALAAPHPLAKPIPTTPAIAVPAPLPDLYTFPGLVSGALLLAERANITALYRPHPLPLMFLRPRLVAHVRRYVGRIGPYPATVEFTWQRPDSVTGTCQLGERPARVLELGTDRHRSAPAGWTRLALVQFTPAPAQAAGRWQLRGWPGPVLTGTWAAADGQRYRLQLRENYVGAMPYDIEQLVVQGGRSVALDEEPLDTRVPFQYQEYLCLLGPAGRHPALRRRLAPPLAVRRRQLRAAYEHERTYGGIEVRLNADYLLSYQATYLADPYGGRPQPGVKSYLVDLVSGRFLTLASQLRLSYELPLRRLLTRHLLAEPLDDSGELTHQIAQKLRADSPPGGEPLVELPLRQYQELTDEDLLLTEQGLEASFSDVVLLGNLWSYDTPTTVIPYTELRPLVRPGTPLARLLQARGMW